LVYDLASADKTEVNRVEVVRQELNDGGEVQFGKVKMVFKRAWEVAGVATALHRETVSGSRWCRNYP
jgi:hypothetical protein